MLSSDALIHSLSFLDDELTLRTCLQAGGVLQEAANEQSLWRRVAFLKYSEEVSTETIQLYHGDWKKMVLDDNLLGAYPSIKLYKNSFWKYSCYNDSLYYCCRVNVVQWDRQNKIVRLHVDAKGESDLYHPINAEIRTSLGQRISPIAWKGSEKAGHYVGCLIFREEDMLHAENPTFHYASEHVLLFGTHKVFDFVALSLTTTTDHHLTFDCYTR